MSWGETHHSAGVRSGPHCMLLTRHIFHVCVCTCVCHAHAAKKSQWCCIVSVARITAWGNNEFLNHNLHVQLCRMGHVDIPLVSDPALCLWCASVHTTSAFSKWRSALIRSLTLRHRSTLCRRSLTMRHRGTLCLLHPYSKCMLQQQGGSRCRIYVYIYISACAVMAHVTKTTKDNECAATVQRKEIYIYANTQPLHRNQSSGHTFAWRLGVSRKPSSTHWVNLNCSRNYKGSQIAEKSSLGICFGRNNPKLGLYKLGHTHIPSGCCALLISSFITIFQVCDTIARNIAETWFPNYLMKTVSSKQLLAPGICCSCVCVSVHEDFSGLWCQCQW